MKSFEKMLRLLKSLSRTVHEERCDQPEGGSSGGGETMSLTVWRKSLFVGCSGFTVIDSEGKLAYRVDNYASRPHEILLMDGPGTPILTLIRTKKLNMVDKWLIYKGEMDNSRSTKSSKKQNPIFYATKEANILRHLKLNTFAKVYGASSDQNPGYTIKGSYLQRSCKVILDSSREVVAEIKRKESSTQGVSFGVEVFVLVVHPGFDPGFAMAIVLLLDQMFL